MNECCSFLTLKFEYNAFIYNMLLFKLQIFQFLSHFFQFMATKNLQRYPCGVYACVDSFLYLGSHLVVIVS